MSEVVGVVVICLYLKKYLLWLFVGGRGRLMVVCGTSVASGWLPVVNAGGGSSA